MKQHFLAYPLLVTVLMVGCNAAPTNTSAETTSPTTNALVGAPEGAIPTEFSSKQPPKVYALNEPEGFVSQAAQRRAHTGTAEQYDILLVNTQKPLSSQSLNFVQAALDAKKQVVLDSSSLKGVSDLTMELIGGSLPEAEAVSIQYDPEVGYLVSPIVNPSSGIAAQGTQGSINTVENVLGF